MLSLPKARKFPNPVATFSDRLLFTTLTPEDVASGATKPYTHPFTGCQVKLFSLAADLKYTPFASDHGPLNLAMTYDACILIHEKLNEQRYASRALCLYSSPDPRLKSNAAVLIALYQLIVERHTPWRAFSPLAKMEFIPFRDAGGLAADYNLSIQDVLWGCWKALRANLLSLQDFDPEAYRYYETVENGDFNWVTPHFIAFASPLDPDFVAGKKYPQSTAIAARKSCLNKAFTNCLHYFKNNGVRVVVRLNDPLYDAREFTDREIAHVDMFFEDGSNPSDEIVRSFIDLAETTIKAGNCVAVHCKAGLGRTGALIGAYLIYKYSLTASEAIGLMRIMRPGMVVGNQQHFLALHHPKWLAWAAVDEYKARTSVGPPAAISSPFVVPQPPTVTAECSNPPLRVTGDAAGQPRKPPAQVPVIPEQSYPAASNPSASPIYATIMRSQSIRTSTPPPSSPAPPVGQPIHSTALPRHGSKALDSAQDKPTKRRTQPLSEVESTLQVLPQLPRTTSADSTASISSKLRRLTRGSNSGEKDRGRTPETPPRKMRALHDGEQLPASSSGSSERLGAGMLKSLRTRASFTRVA